MFDIFFGWRKASKCKKLIRRVQCRLRLLKNKRCAIVRQLREDIAQLLRHGHEQSAFDRVEQLYKDETTVSIYDLLETFCEFIIINFPYIRKHKDFPNDINEAVSSLIYASARLGDLPELILIRKLFGKRYGQRFESVALQLLPGNLVNRQIKDKLCMKSISEDVKYRLVEEIARSCFKSGPLLIEFSSEFQQHLANKSSPDQILSIEFPISHDIGKTDQNQANSSIAETELRICYVNFSSGSDKSIKDPGYNCQDSITSVPFSCSPRASQVASNTEESSMHDKEQKIVKSAYLDYKAFDPEKEGALASSRTHSTGFKFDDRDMIVDSLSESSDNFPTEMIYFDDIVEFETPVSKEGNYQDQRLFVFKSTSEKIYNESLKEKSGLKNENGDSRNSGSSKKMSGKRLRKQSISLEKISVTDKECAIYYGSSESSPNFNHKLRHPRKHHKKVEIQEKNRSNCSQGSTDVHSCFVNESSAFTFGECKHDHMKSSCRCSFNGGKVSHCSLEHPCYFCTIDDTNYGKSPISTAKSEISKRLSTHSLQEKIIKREEPDIHKITQTEKGYQDPWTMKETHPPYLRAMTMPPERLKDTSTDSILRSKSFPVQQPGGESSNRHVHPKLPDYDELAAKFLALKTAYMQSKQ